MDQAEIERVGRSPSASASAGAGADTSPDLRTAHHDCEPSDVKRLWFAVAPSTTSRSPTHWFAKDVPS